MALSENDIEMTLLVIGKSISGIYVTACYIMRITGGSQ